MADEILERIDDKNMKVISEQVFSKEDLQKKLINYRQEWERHQRIVLIMQGKIDKVNEKLKVFEDK